MKNRKDRVLIHRMKKMLEKYHPKMILLGNRKREIGAFERNRKVGSDLLGGRRLLGLGRCLVKDGRKG